MLPTSQFVAVNGKRDHIHPDCVGLSEVKRTYLGRTDINISHLLPTIHQPGTRIGRGKARDLLICANDSIPAPIEPPTLKFRIQVRLYTESTSMV